MSISLRCFNLFLASCHSKNNAPTLIISNVNIVDVKTGAILYKRDIQIKNDRIIRIEDHQSFRPGSYAVVNGDGKFIIPGLWDMHAHIVSYDWVPKLYTAMGVTGVRIMHGGSRIADVVEKRKDGFYEGFEFLYGSPIVDGPGENWSGSLVASTPEEGRKIVREIYDKGYDFVKVYNWLSYDTYMAIADECKKLNFPFSGHVPMSVTTEEAIAAGQKSIEHTIGLDLALQHPKYFNRRFNTTDTLIFHNLDLYTRKFLEDIDSSLFKNVLTKTSHTPTWFCPTLVLFRSRAFLHDSTFIHDEKNQYIPGEEFAIWKGAKNSGEFPDYLSTKTDSDIVNNNLQYYKLSLSMLKPMLVSGTRFLTGTDISNPYLYPGFSVHEELQLFVEAGFTELEALQTATINPAIYIRRESDLGTVEEGKIANLVLLDKNPLEKISNTKSIAGVIKRGNYLDSDTLKGLLESVKKLD